MRIRMNKFVNELAQLNSELKMNNSDAEKARADITFLKIFNEAATRSEILDLIKAFKQKKLLFDSHPIQLIMPVRGFFETIFGLSECNEDRQKKADAEHKRYKNELALEIAKLDTLIKAGQSLIERYKSLNEYQLHVMIKTYECRKEIIHGKIQSVLAKCEKLKQAIGPVLENAVQYRQQVCECEDGLKACQAYLEQLANFHNFPADRRKVHEACAKQFNGNGRPSDVAYDLNKKLESIRHQLIKVEDRIDNEIKKIDVEPNFH